MKTLAAKSIQNTERSSNLDIELVNDNLKVDGTSQEPFTALKIAPVERLIELSSRRVICPTCKKSESLFCPNCLVPFEIIPPRVSLPINVHIYRHPNEKVEKTTISYLKLANPDHVSIIPDDLKTGLRYTDPTRIVILYPSEVIFV